MFLIWYCREGGEKRHFINKTLISCTQLPNRLRSLLVCTLRQEQKKLITQEKRSTKSNNFILDHAFPSGCSQQVHLLEVECGAVLMIRCSLGAFFISMV